MTNFNRQYGKHNNVVSEVGSPVARKWMLEYDTDGVQTLVPAGSTNLYNSIQSHKDSVDIGLILQRFANGEEDVLNQVSSFFSDVSDMPMSFSELLNMNFRAEDAFNQLPLDIREQFNNSYVEFMCADPEFINGIFHPVENSVVPGNDFVDDSDLDFDELED